MGDGLAVWPVTVGMVEVGLIDSQPGADAERYRCAYLHCTQGLVGRGAGFSAASTGGFLVFYKDYISIIHSVLLSLFSLLG